MAVPEPRPVDILRDRFGFGEFRPGQREVMSALWRRRAALAVFPTGGGKSLCYQLPALMFEGVTLVVSPLIALMKDQIDFLRARGIPAARVDSSLGADEVAGVNEAIRAGTLKLLYVSPERFNNERFLEQMTRARIGLLAIDEAHCISEWGHNFRPDYLKLARLAHDLGVERVLALTATATPTVVADICQGFGIPADCAIVTGFYRPNLRMLTTPVAADGRDAVLVGRLRSREPGPTIVYVTLQRTAERVAAMLQDAGMPARAYHAGMQAEERTAVQEWWMASDRGIVAATIAFGMGIDKADVRYVYHYNLPKSLESYSQEIGRAGRDGQLAVVEMVACPEDVPTLENFAYGDTPTEDALRGLVGEVLGLGEEFSLNLQELADRHDLRPLVLRTALTYLELLGILRQGTPYYAGYAVRPAGGVESIAAQFPGEPGEFVRRLFAAARAGRLWYRLDPDEAAEALGQDRKRVVRALEVLQARGLAEVTASDLRQRYVRLRGPDGDSLVPDLVARFHRREAQEVERIQRVLGLVTHPGCQTNALVGYFGEARGEPCGHCTFCLSGRALALPRLHPQPPMPVGLDVGELADLRAANPGALAAPRQVARFLCGLASPATTRAGLTRMPLFGALADRRFADVLVWAEGV